VIIHRNFKFCEILEFFIPPTLALGVVLGRADLQSPWPLHVAP